MEYLSGLLVNFELYLILALSLNLLVGYAGLISLCHAAFYGVGAYTAALLMLRLGWALPSAMMGAMVVTMVLGAVVALPSLRLRDDYFIIATVALQAIVYRALNNLEGVTRGPLGLTDIPPARVAGMSVPPESPWFPVLTTVTAAAVVLVIARLARSPFGRVLRGLRDDEVAVEALGRSVASFKVRAFLVGSACAAVAGALLAVRMGTLVPDQFTIAESMLILTALIIGGAGNLVGPVVGAALVTALPEVLRYAGGGYAAVAGEVRQIAFGLLLIGLLRWRPQGVAGEYRFE
jgi:branched-chain amino acid transport system permease protein